MVVNRIVPDITADNLADAHRFYHDLLGLKLVMELDWIVTYAAEKSGPLQINIGMHSGHADKPRADISIDVDDVDAVYRDARAAGYAIVYDITDEPWGVRRFFVRDPFGKVINVLSHN